MCLVQYVRRIISTPLPRVCTYTTSMVPLLSLDWHSGANNKDIRNHLVNFYLIHLSTTQNQVWKGLWAAIVRSIWEQRNQVVFRGRIPDADEVFQNAELVSWLWLKHKAAGFSYAFSDWLLQLYEKCSLHAVSCLTACVCVRSCD